MRLTYVLAVFSCAVFGSALAVPRQDEPLAETQFKNITSFKGSKASDVIPAMEFMSASLGVSCDYCHTEDRASDSKEEKRTAREMIAMQRDINTRNFRGRNVVTCSSCHAGHTRPVPVPPVEGAQVRARRSTDVKADNVLAAYGKAVGGDPTHPIGAIRLTGTSVTHGETGKVDAVYAGEKFKFVTHGAKADTTTAFNGTTAWLTTPKGVLQIPLVYATQYLREYTIFNGPNSLPKLTNTSGATAQLTGRDVLVINGTIEADKTRVSLYFDKKSGLLVRSLFGYPSVLGSIVQTNDYADYKKVGGVELPMTISIHSAQGDTVTKFTSAKVEANVDASAFEVAK